MADSRPKASRSKSTKVNFVLLKHILEDQSSETTDDESQETISDGNERNQDDESVEKTKKMKENLGPTGRYPVLFSKRCKSKSCQTRLSAFPLFSVPEDTEWISDGEDSPIKIKKKIKKSDEKKERRWRGSADSKGLKSGKNNEKEMEDENSVKIEEKTKDKDVTRKEFSSEHQLKDTKNPLLQAWLHQKNKLTRKIRKEERKVKRAQKAALEEEERLKSERFEESDKKVSEWFKDKRRETRKKWRQNHPKISPFYMASDEPNITSPPPPEYRVIKSFKSQKSSSAVRQTSGSSAGSARVYGLNKSSKTSYKRDSVNINEDLNTTNDIEYQSAKSISQSTKSTESHNVVNVESDSSKGEYNETQQTPERPKTAQNRTPNRKKVSRPKTAASTPTHNDKHQMNKSTEKMNSLKYDDWLKCKRKQDKKSTIEKRRELIDSHLDAVIAKLGKQRVENIMSSRKRIDTGLKDYNRSAAKSPIMKKSSYKWVSEHEAPRPEPQGCDCPEVEHIDGKVYIVPVDNMTFPEDTSGQGELSPASQKKQATNFCKEVTEKCEGLKPSMEKVLAVLDVEIQQRAQKQKTRIKSPTYKAPSGISTTNATIISLDNENSSDIYTLNIPGTVESSSNILDTSKDMSPHPKSAGTKRPTLVANTSMTVEEAKKKIFHDMDVLGLCADPDELISDDNTGNDDYCNQSIGNNDIQSTVRSNYFDYGTDVDIPTMETLE